MNQILINQKLYVTPELKRKKKIYKFDFILSVFVLITLASVCIYAEYDRNKSEQVSQQMLSDINTSLEEKKQAQSDILVIALNNAQENLDIEAINNQENDKPVQVQKDKYVTSGGYTYYTIK